MKQTTPQCFDSTLLLFLVGFSLLLMADPNQTTNDFTPNCSSSSSLFRFFSRSPTRTGSTLRLPSHSPRTQNQPTNIQLWLTSINNWQVIVIWKLITTITISRSLIFFLFLSLPLQISSLYYHNYFFLFLQKKFICF